MCSYTFRPVPSYKLRLTMSLAQLKMHLLLRGLDGRRLLDADAALGRLYRLGRLSRG